MKKKRKQIHCQPIALEGKCCKMTFNCQKEKALLLCDWWPMVDWQDIENIAEWYFTDRCPSNIAGGALIIYRRFIVNIPLAGMLDQLSRQIEKDAPTASTQA